jgi:hypothetical protein
MVRAFQIDILNEVKEQVIHESGLTSNDLKLVAYTNVIEIIEEKIDEINKSMDETIEEMNNER